MAGVKLTAFQQEQMKAVNKVMEYKEIAEANIVSIFFKEPDSIFNFDLKIDDFHKNCWKVYFVILEELIIKEKKIPDDATIAFYLEKHPKLSKKFDEYGGIRTLEDASSYVKIENLDGYVEELRRWGAVLKLIKYGFPVYHRLSEFADMNAESIFGEYEAILNHVFANVEGNIKSYNATEDIHKLIDIYNEGAMVGLPLNQSDILNKEIGGLNKGQIYGCGAGTGVGKTTTALHWLLPSVIHHNESIVLIINEENEIKIRSELLIYVINNIFKEEFKKNSLRNGKFSEEQLKILRKAADWIEEKKESKHITIIPLEKYTTNITIKIINKYSNLGNSIFLLDTLKPSSDSNNDNVWLQMQRDMVDLYNVIKPSNKNCVLWVNYQLGKSALKRRFLTNEDVGLSRSILDVMSVNIMIRNVLDSEYEGGKHELIGYKIVGKSKIQFKLNDRNKRIVVIFITKNRFGDGNIQILAEHNLSTNRYSELGWCRVPEDF